MPELRDYQQALRNDAESGLRPGKARLMLQLPTGGGKTVIAGDILARRLKANPNAAAVWLTHRVELAQQTRGMLRAAGVRAESRPGWDGDEAPRVANGVAILMAQTVGRQEPTWNRYGENDLLVVDEAHHATAESWQKAIQWWPGPALGMTATPWRLSVKEGFDHLFGELLLGPQVHQLQAQNHLCQARVLAPEAAATILGGEIDDTGDYNLSGIIDQANLGRPEVLKAGVLRFWQQHAAGRQTVVYAVSVGHANNLALTFQKAGIDAQVIESKTPKKDRANIVKSFRDGNLTVLINVAIATEGFDLPDASCVVLARPTLSLALYLQMVGRGLRPKPEGNKFRDCLILDLAGNAEFHGLPEEQREWFLEARGEASTGQGRVVRCNKCNGVSPTSSHYCRDCNAPFGQECQRCGKWRVWAWWVYETHCGRRHAPVCDLCHYDAHIAQIQLTLDLPDEPPHLGELHQLMAAQISELQGRIRQLDNLLKDENARDEAFGVHISQLPNPPKGFGAVARAFTGWERQLKSDIDKWRLQLSRIESGNPDDSETLDKIHQGLQAVLPQPATTAATGIDSPANAGQRGNTLQLTTWLNAPKSLRIASIQPPVGPAITLENTDDILPALCEWLIGQGHLTKESCPIMQSKRAKISCLVNTQPRHVQRVSGSAKFRDPVELSNGLYLENDLSGSIAQRCGYLLDRFGMDAADFRADLADKQYGDSGLSVDLPAAMDWADQDDFYDATDFWEVESIVAPTGQIIADDESTGILVGLAEWLVDQGELRAERCPFMPPGGRTRYLVNDQPAHRNGRNFNSPVKLSNGLYLEKSQNDFDHRWAELLEHFGQDPSQFRVNLAEIQDDDDD